MDKVRVVDFITDYLYRQYDVKYIFMLSGGGSIYLDDSVAKHPHVKGICVRNEATAPMMANGYVKAGGKLGVVYVTTGPGSANAIAGLVESWVDSCPVLIISGQVPSNQTVDNMGKDLRFYGTQELNVSEIVIPIVKSFQSLGHPSFIKDTLDVLIAKAISGRKGPVWLEIPLDMQGEEIDVRNLRESLEDNLFDYSSFFDEDYSQDIDDLIDLLKKAKKPLIVAGQGVKGAITELKILLDNTGIPIIFSRMGLDLLPYSYENNLGLGGIKGRRYNKKVMKEADLVIAIGTTLSPAFSGHNLEFFKSDVKIAIVDIDFEELIKFQSYYIEEEDYLYSRANLLLYHAGAKRFLQELNQKLNFRPRINQWKSYIKGIKQKNKISYSNKKNIIDIYDFFLVLNELSQENDIFVTDAGSCYYAAGQVLEFTKEGQKDICSGAYASMGVGLPLSIGVALQKLEKSRIIAVIGDGSIETNIQELKTLSYYGLNVKLFIINNGGYISMRDHQDKLFDGRYINSNEETGNPVLNFKDIAKAFGLPYKILEFNYESSLLTIKRDTEEILNLKGPVLIEVICDSNQKLIEPITKGKKLECIV